MRRLSLAMLVTGASLLAATGFAGARSDGARLQQGGVFRVGTTGSSVQVDPQLAYLTTAWWLQYATAAKLYNYPDRRAPAGLRLEPEVASKFTVGDGGRTYTFFIRKGFRFSDGTPVTASSFKYAINRVANRELASPGAPFITDENGTNIVGAEECNSNPSCTDVSGVTARGNKLTIRLTEPDGTFMSTITMPFFQATSTKLHLDREVVAVSDIASIPSAGPYAYSRNDVDQLTSIRRNPFWKRGPGRMRPRNLAGVDIQWSLNEQTAFQQVKSNELDRGPLPASEVQATAQKYGVNKTRFWTKPINCTGFLPMNMANDLFKGNPKLRRAVSYAIDRRAYAEASVTGGGAPHAARPLSRLLNPTVPGWANVDPYPLRRNLVKARKLAAGQFRDGKITVYFRSAAIGLNHQAQIVRRDLINLGFSESNITMKAFFGRNIYTAMGRRGNDADIGVSMGWCSDYPDPYGWINVLLYGGNIVDENNTNFSYMNHPKWNRRMEAAAKLVGPKRHRVYGQLDLDIMRKVAPMAVAHTYNNRYFFSKRVDPKSLVYQGIYSDFSIPALALR